MGAAGTRTELGRLLPPPTLRTIMPSSAVDLLAAPLSYRMLISGAPIDRGFAHRMVDAVQVWIRDPP
jgi:hypothetical protein